MAIFLVGFIINNIKIMVGLTEGVNAELELKTPSALGLKFGYKREVSVKRTGAETEVDQLKWSVNTEINVSILN